MCFYEVMKLESCVCVCVSELAQFSTFCIDFYSKWVLILYQETHCLQTKFTNITLKSSSVRRYTIIKNKLGDMMVICGEDF